MVSFRNLVTNMYEVAPVLPLAQSRLQEAYSVSLKRSGADNFLITGLRLGMQIAAIAALGDDMFGYHVGALLSEKGVTVR